MLASQLIDACLNLVHALRQLLRGLCQGFGIEHHAVHLHLGQYRHQRHLDVIEEALAVVLLQLGLQAVLQLKRDVGIFACVFIDEGRGEVTHRALAFSFWSDELINVHRLIVQVGLGHVVHVVTQLWLNEIMCYHRVPHRSLKTDVIVAKHLKVVLEVLSNF